jgi:hypothetical protein
MVRVHGLIRNWSSAIVKRLSKRLRGVLIAVAALALSAGLAFGAQPEPGWGLTNAAAHAGKTVPVRAGQQDTDEEVVDDTDDLEDEDTDEAVDEEVDEDAGGGENCATDPSTLTPEELAALKHGSIVCWAAHQKEWPEWFAKHGDFVKCWAHNGKADAPSCTEDPNAEEPAADGDPAATSAVHGKSQGKGNGHNK